jgi:AcrR family transcriptional regulator
MNSITQRTKLSKGSLYHFFPGGKDEMAAEILAHVHGWFVTKVFEPLEKEEPGAAIRTMWQAVDDYFRSGRCICLIGAFALDETRDRFARPIRTYFKRWIEALENALKRGGVSPAPARALAEEAVIGIQGALTLARALNDKAIFGRSLRQLAERLERSLVDK